MRQWTVDTNYECLAHHAREQRGWRRASHEQAMLRLDLGCAVYQLRSWTGPIYQVHPERKDCTGCRAARVLEALGVN